MLPLALATIAAVTLMPLRGPLRAAVSRAYAIAGNVDDDDYDDEYDPRLPLALQMLSRGPTLMGRYAPARGKGLNTRDAGSAAAIRRLLSTRAPLALDTASLPPIRLTSRLGEGRFGDVLRGESDNGESFAVKVALRPNSRLRLEADILRSLGGAAGFPRLLHHQRAGDGGDGLELLVMELLGRPLQSEWEAAGRRFDAPTTRSVCRSARACLARLHALGYAHNDLKPGNLLRGGARHGAGASERLLLVDFGMATRLGGAEAPQVGSSLYASVAAHEAARPTGAGDDFESLAYVLVHLAAGQLPWEDAPAADVHAMKRRALQGGGEALIGGVEDEAMRTEIRGLLASVPKCDKGVGVS